MTALAQALLLSVGFIVVEVDGDATEVVAWRDRVERTAEVTNGRAVLGPMPLGAYVVYARGGGAMSEPVSGVRAVAAPAAPDGTSDVVLRCRPARAVRVKSSPGAALFWRGVELALTSELPVGLHRVVVFERGRVSSAERWVRVDAERVEWSQPLDGGLVVLGEVVDAAGEPVEGAHVTFFGDGYARGMQAWTDERGSFGTAGLSSDEITVTVRAPGYAVARRRVVFPAGRSQARVSVTMRAASQAVVRVVDGRGLPLRDATITLLPRWLEDAIEERRVRANAAPETRRGSRARFAHLVPGREYRILVSAPDHEPVASAPFRAPAAGSVRDVGTLKLEAAASILVQAQPGEEWTCVGSGGVSRTRTDRRGRAQFQGLDAGTHRLFASMEPTFVRTVETDDGGTATVRMEVLPSHHAQLRGVVGDADGKPLAGVRVRVLDRTATSRDDGSFVLRALPAGIDRWTVSFEPGPGCRALADDPHLPRVERKVASGSKLRVRLERAGTLRLRLDGARLTRARLEISATGSGLRRTVRLGRRQRDVVVRDLPVGGYVVGVRAPGVLSPAQRIVQAKRGDADPTSITLTSGRRVSGRVSIRFPRGARVEERPAERGWVVLVDGDSLHSLAYAEIEFDGTFSLAGLPARPVVLAATAPGYPPTWTSVDLTSGDARDVTFALRKSAEAAVRVLGARDSVKIIGKGQGAADPLPNARVRFRTEFGLDVFDFIAFARFRYFISDDEDVDAFGPLFRMQKSGARFAIRAAPGSYRVLVTADGYQTARVGVRARTRESLGNVGVIPSLPADWASTIRLVRESK